METRPYRKHQLFRGNYEMTEGGTIKVPDKSHWVVLRYIGDCKFVEFGNEGEIALILEEKCSEKRRFWSVISFLTPEEALQLAEQLNKAARGK